MSPRIVGIGEVLWDLLPGGRELGGAPANFTFHACALGAEARLISRVGDDPAGREALERLRALGLSLDCLQVDPQRPTGTVSVHLSSDGQPSFTIHENVAWDAIAEDQAARRAVVSADAVCFGSLAQRSEPSRSTIRSLLAAAPQTSLRILDVNLRAPFYSRDIIETSILLANVLKLNETELPILASYFNLRGDERRQLEELTSRYNIRCIAYTLGKRGSLLLSHGQWSLLPAAKIDVVDSVGAGDAFTAALAVGLLANWPLEKIHRHASDLAGYVCTQAGATPMLPDAITANFKIP